MPQISMIDIFEEAQKGMQTHNKLIKNLLKIYHSVDLDRFWEEFVGLGKHAMIVYQRHASVERIIDFMAKFATSLCMNEKDKKRRGSTEDEESDDDDYEDEMNPFLLKLFTFCLEHHNAREKAVRFRLCQMINKLLNSMGEQAQIDDELYERIYECMLQRLRDKFPNVRIQATLALSRLQDPHDADCPIINAYMFLLGCDPNPDVRRAVLGVIAASTKTLAAILERTRDVKDVVRKVAYQVIAEKVHMRAFTIAQRVRILQEGLHDRTELVREACSSRLLQAWLRLFEGNILELLKALDVENCLETAEVALKAMFKKTPSNDLVENFDLLNEHLVLPLNELTPESVLYWRCMVEYMAELGTSCEEQLEKILPDATAFADFMTKVLVEMRGEEIIDNQLRNEFMLQQLLALADVIDVTDQVRRQNLRKLVRDMLLNDDVTYGLVKPLVELFSKLSPSEGRVERERVDALIEIISDIRMPITQLETSRSSEEQRKLDLKLASVRVELNELREELARCISEQEFERAATIKANISACDATKNRLLSEGQVPMTQEVRTEKTDCKTLMKCLSISSEMLQHLSLAGLTPSLQELIQSLILPGITNPDPAVRNVAVRCLGLCCLLDLGTARKHLLLFMQISQMDVEGVKITALRVLFDILHSFGLDAFGVSDTVNTKHSSVEQDDGGDATEGGATVVEDDDASSTTDADKTANSILTVLISLLDSQSSELRTVAAEGLAKLMLCGRVLSAHLMSRLVLLWYNPVTEDDNKLRHCLGAFFPIFAFAGQSNQQVVEEAFMLTLNTLFNAPATSPLASVDVNNVAELLVQLTDASHIIKQQVVTSSQDSYCHDNIAVTVCNDILSDANSFNARTLCRVLTLLNINANNYPTLKQLMTLSENLVKDVKDKQCAKMVEKFHKHVRALLMAAKQNPLIGTPGPLSAESRTSVDEPQQEAEMTSVDDTGAVGTTADEFMNLTSRTSNSMDVDDSRLIDPNTSHDNDRRRKARKGKKLLRSINETPISQRPSTRRTTDESLMSDGSVVPETPQFATGSHVPIATTTESETNKSRTSDSEADMGNKDNNAATSDAMSAETYASPMPVRRTRQARRSKPTAASLRRTRKNIDELLSESDTQSDAGEAPAATASVTRSAAKATPTSRQTRSSRKRTKQEARGPLNTIGNE